MAVGDSNYQGGGEVVLTNFYNTLRQDEFRRQQQDAAEQQARNKAREQTAKDLEDVTSKLTSKGLRNQAEIDIYTKMYEDVKNYKALANSAETASERAKYITLTRDTAKKAMEFVDGAEEFKKGEVGILGKFQTDPLSYGEDQKTLLKTNLEKPYTQLGTRFDPTPYSTRLKPEEVDKIVDTRIKGLVDAQGKLLARTEAFTVGNNVGNMLYQDINLAPELAVKDLQKLISTNIGVKEHFQRLYPSLAPEELAINIVKDRMESGKLANRDTTGSFIQNDKPEKESKADVKKREDINTRARNLKALVQNKDQETFEAVKASLPANSKMKWRVQNVKNVKTGKVESKVIGLELDIPAGYDQYGINYGAIQQKIDFTKGDPVKVLNGIFNRFVGKNIENEDLEKVEGNTSKRKPTTNTTTAKPNTTKFDPIAYYNEQLKKGKK